MEIGDRDTDRGWWLIYQGGHHRVWCDGSKHHRTFDDGRVERDVMKCENWVGGCPVQLKIGGGQYSPKY